MPLPSLALYLLRELRGLTGRDEYLFPAPTNDGRPIETKIIERFISLNLSSGIFEDMQRWSKHDLRRTIATNMGKLGIDELIIARLSRITLKAPPMFALMAPLETRFLGFKRGDYFSFFEPFASLSFGGFLSGRGFL